MSWSSTAKAIVAAVLFLGFWIAAPLLGWVVFPLLGLAWRRRTAAARVAGYQRIVGWLAARLVDAMRWVGLVDFVPAHAAAPPAGAYVLVANHPTLIDVVLLLAVHRRLCCVAKPILFRNPLTGRFLRALEHIESAPADAPMAGAAVVTAAIARLAAGLPVLVFPEGTRSPAGGLGRIGRGPFEIAARAGVPVVATYIDCAPLALGRGMPWYAIPAARVHMALEPLPLARAAVVDPGAAADEVGGLLAARLAAATARD